MNIVQLCNTLKKGAEDYKRICKELTAARDAKRAEIEETYNKTSPAYTKAFMEAEEAFAAKLIDAQVHFADSADKAIEGLKDAEWKSVGRINNERLDKLRAVADIPMSPGELDIVMDMTKAKGDYWAEKLCSDIAAKNGFALDVSTPYDKKMEILEELGRQVKEVIDHYPAQDPAMRPEIDILYLNANVMRNAVKMYSGLDWMQTDESKAKQIYFSILQESGDLRRATALKTALENPEPELHNLLLCYIATNSDLSDFVIKFSGHSGEIEAFRAGRAEEYLAARGAIKRVENATNETVARRICQENENNRFFGSLLERARMNSDVLAEVAPDERDMPRDKWLKKIQDEYLEMATHGQVHPEDVDGGDN